MTDALMTAGLHLRAAFYHYARMEQARDTCCGVCHQPWPCPTPDACRREAGLPELQTRAAVDRARAEFDRMMHEFFKVLERTENEEAVEEAEEAAARAEDRREQHQEQLAEADR